jgi:hypothetical protein
MPGNLVRNTPVLKEAKDDPLIQFLQGKGFSRQAWVCTGCPGDEYVQGNSYIGLAMHLASNKHKKSVAALSEEGGAEPTE